MTAKDLKNALLQEAVQGKLVPQIAAEGNARDLLEEIRKEKLSHGFANSYGICDGKNKKTKKSDLRSKSQIRVTKISADEIPFDIPENWCWCKLGDIAEVSSSKRIYANEQTTTGVPFLRVSDLVAKINGIEKNDLYISEEHYMSFKKNGLVPKPNDVLITSRGTLGLCYIIKENDKFYFQDGMITWLSLPTNILPKYLCILFDSNFMQTLINKKSNGTAVSYISIADIKKITFPLPPLAEQKRIVAAIEKFLPLIEEYGKKETELNAFNEQIGTLTKKAILQEAVQGKLVPQIATEGNAKDLLEEIKKEKAKLIKEGKLKKGKPLPEITEDEIPFDIPESWCWCKVGDLFSTMSGLGYKKDVLNEKTPRMIRVLRGGNILDTSYVFKDDDIMISDKYVKSELFLKKNYLITPAVTSLEHIGKIGYIGKDYADTVVGGFVLMLIPHYSDEVLSKYCLYLFGTRWFRDMCKEITHKSGQAFYNLSRDKLLNLVIPLAPLAEQKRIVTAIEKFLPLCEKLGA